MEGIEESLIRDRKEKRSSLAPGNPMGSQETSRGSGEASLSCR